MLRACIALAVALHCGCVLSAAAQTDDFYRRKNIRLIVGSDVGAGFSAYSQLVGTFFGRHVPGAPTVTVEHMPGAGGVNSLNYLANAAPTDGTAFAVAMPNFFVTPWTEPKSVRFDPGLFRFLGRASEFGRVLAVWHTSGVKNIDDLKRGEVTLGASSRVSTTSVAPMMMNEMLGTKFRIITGYSGTGPTMFAIERGEIASTTVAWSTLMSLHRKAIDDGTLRVVAGLDFNEVPIPGVPRVRDLIKDEKQRAQWDFRGAAGGVRHRLRDGAGRARRQGENPARGFRRHGAQPGGHRRGAETQSRSLAKIRRGTRRLVPAIRFANARNHQQ